MRIGIKVTSIFTIAGYFFVVFLLSPSLVYACNPNFGCCSNNDCGSPTIECAIAGNTGVCCRTNYDDGSSATQQFYCCNDNAEVVRSSKMHYECDGGNGGSWCTGPCCNYDDPTDCPICSPDYQIRNNTDPNATCTSTCTVSDPNPPSLVSPKDETTLQTNDVTLTWLENGVWGQACPQNVNQYYAYLSEYPDYSPTYESSGAIAPPPGATVPSQTFYDFDNLKWGEQYYWTVGKNNGARYAAPGSWSFTTAKPPSIDSVSISTGGTCGNNYVGRYSDSDDDDKTNNPITIQATYSDSGSDFAEGTNRFSDVYVAIIPQSTIDSEPGWGEHLSLSTIINSSSSDNLAFFTMTNLSNEPKSYGYIDSSQNQITYTEAGPGSSLQKNYYGDYGAALNITGEELVEDGNQSIATAMEIELAGNWPAGERIHIYTGAAIELGSSEKVSSNANEDGNPDEITLTRADNLEWYVDLDAPSVALDVRDFDAQNQFEVERNVTDASDVDIYSYCHLQGIDTELDLRLTSPSSQNFTITDAEQSYPNPSNCPTGYSGNSGTSVYAPREVYSAEIKFKLSAEDQACNVTNTDDQQPDPSPWLTTTEGNVGVGGVDNLRIRDAAEDVLDAIISGLGEIGSYLARYFSISSDNLAIRQSAASLYDTNHVLRDTQPPNISGFNSWYDLAERVIDDNYAFRDVSSFGSPEATISGNLSSAFGVDADELVLAKFDGDVTSLTVEAGTVCNIKAIIIVDGDITIKPNLTKTGVENGCVFINKNGNIQVDSGNYASSGIPVGERAQYDQVDAYLISDQEIRTYADYGGNGEVADGLLISGGAVAEQAFLKRDLGFFNNSRQPSEVIEYDPAFTEIFREVLSFTTFSIRAL